MRHTAVLYNPFPTVFPSEGKSANSTPLALALNITRRLGPPGMDVPIGPTGANVKGANSRANGVVLMPYLRASESPGWERG